MKTTLKLMGLCLILAVVFGVAAGLIIQGAYDCRYSDVVNSPCADTISLATYDVLRALAGIFSLLALLLPIVVHTKRKVGVKVTPLD